MARKTARKAVPSFDDLITNAIRPGETLEDFAGRCGLTARAIHYLRKGTYAPRMGTIAALALALGTSAEVVKAAIAASGKRSKGG